MIDIRSIYASIANQAITRACDAHSLHGEFGDIADASELIGEEFEELAKELRYDDVQYIYPSILREESDINWERAYQESIDLAVVSIRNAHLCLRRMNNATETIETPNKPKLSDVIMADFTFEGKQP
jgi:hypothetical protein